LGWTSCLVPRDRDRLKNKKSRGPILAIVLILLGSICFGEIALAQGLMWIQKGEDVFESIPSGITLVNGIRFEYFDQDVPEQDRPQIGICRFIDEQNILRIGQVHSHRLSPRPCVAGIKEILPEEERGSKSHKIYQTIEAMDYEILVSDADSYENGSYLWIVENEISAVLEQQYVLFDAAQDLTSPRRAETVVCLGLNITKVTVYRAEHAGQVHLFDDKNYCVYPFEQHAYAYRYPDYVAESVFLSGMAAFVHTDQSPPESYKSLYVRK